MRTIQPGGGEMKAITISRQYGSVGGEVGARLAERLNWHLIDHELVAQVARELGIPEQQAQGRDEYAEGFIARVLSHFIQPVLTTPYPCIGYVRRVTHDEITDAVG